MKTITTMLVFIAFLYIVINKRFKGRKTVSKDNDAVKQSDKSASSLPSYPNNVPVIPLSDLNRDGSYRYDVMVFNSLEYEGGLYKPCDAAYFASRIDSKLSLLVAEMIEKGFPYRLDFISVGTSLLVLVTYQIDSKKDTNMQTSSET